MTVICYRDGVLATDSGAWCGDVYLGTGKKIDRLRDDSMLAACGRWQDTSPEVLRYLGGPHNSEKPKVADDFAALLIRTDGSVWQVGSNLELWRLRAAFYAEGSGFQVAIGAMAAGATAIQAVEIACEHHARCRGPVQVCRLQDEKWTFS